MTYMISADADTAAASVSVSVSVSVSADLPDHVHANRARWDAMADRWVGAGERSWAQSEPSWGVFASPQSEVPFLPDDVDGLDAIELGCATAYVSA
jgi:hypothetical protein